jgi:hypothetical protein
MSGVYSQYPGWNASLVSYTVQNNEDRPIALTVSSEIQDFTSIARTTQIIPAHTKKTLQQNPQLKPSVDLQEITPATLHYVISDSFGQTLAEQTLPISLLAKDTMVWSTYDGTEWVDTSGLIAAWVTPNAPAVGELVRKAASKLEGGMGGYQCPLCNGSQDWQINSQRQVQAIYDTLQSDYQIAYVNAPISFSAKGDSTQKIKPPEESIRLSSANCIDGAVLFASAIEYAGMNPYIVISPTHAIVCWGISGNEGSIDCLETTYVGRYGFAEANAKGYEEYTRLQQDGDFQASRARILSIKDLRASGIRPMS